MKVTYENDNITISIYDLVDNLSDEAKRDLGQQILWSKDAFNDILDAIINDQIVSPRFGYNIFDARAKILNGLDILQRNHFRSLITELERANLDKARWEQDYWNLYHSIPDGPRGWIPERTPFTPRKFKNDKEVDTLMDEYINKPNTEKLINQEDKCQ